ncbi:MAG: Eco57I restriction-modification methylase domain-containing protein [Candidatus Kaiserbacteria bacterium]|nr:Eco57I restriction-modification methylase domain-containing protein [Candidatus Kaiserbacteria bacterium]
MTRERNKNTSCLIDMGTGDYADIEKFFNKLNEDQSHFVNSNDESTPIGCVKEMVDTIPDSFWRKKNLKILDPCAGNGNFHAYIFNKKTKIENLIFNEINDKRVKNIRKIFGNSANISLKNFLEFNESEEYDLVVSNPPYAKFNSKGRTAKNHNLSRDFIRKAIKITKKNGFILFIVPDNWMSFADRNDVVEILSQYQFLHLNIHGAKKWFPKIGSSFSWFLLQKTKNSKPFTVENFYKVKSTERVKIDPGVRFIPLYYSPVVKSIIDKTINADNEKYQIETSSDLHKHTKKDLLSVHKNNIYRYKVIHTPTQVVWSKRPHKYQSGYKVFISLTNQYSTFINRNCGATQSVAFIRCKSKEEAEQVKGELDSPIYSFLNNVTRYGNFNNIRVLQHFPKIRSFLLTKKERSFVETFNKEYYKRMSTRK